VDITLLDYFHETDSVIMSVMLESRRVRNSGPLKDSSRIDAKHRMHTSSNIRAICNFQTISPRLPSLRMYGHHYCRRRSRKGCRVYPPSNPIKMRRLNAFPFALQATADTCEIDPCAQGKKQLELHWMRTLLHSEGRQVRNSVTNAPAIVS
jgi:hypothetical protein